MAEQYDFFGGCAEPTRPKKPPDNQKRNWENGFQKWSDAQLHNDGEPLGKCGYGSMCDYCEDNTYGRPCVRALNEMCRERKITIDYTKRNYEEIWGL